MQAAAVEVAANCLALTVPVIVAAVGEWDAVQ